MGEFTLHDGEHLFRVLSIMELLLSSNVIKNLSTPELQLLILSAFMHDIGMAPEEKDVLAWRKIWDYNLYLNQMKKNKYEEFKRFFCFFCSSR